MKIEKLITKQMVSQTQSIPILPTSDCMVMKINELIDALNKLTEIFDASKEYIYGIPFDMSKYKKEEKESKRFRPAEVLFNNLSDKDFPTVAARIYPKEEKEPEILPCGWCNIDATICEIHLGRAWSVICSNQLDCPIRAETKLFKTKQEAIAAWNKRSK